MSIMKPGAPNVRFAQWLIAAGFSVPLLSLIVATVMTYSSTRAMWDSFQWMPVSQQIESSLGDVLSSLNNLELGQREYLLTGESEPLAQFEKAKAMLPVNVSTLEAVIGDDVHRVWVLDGLRHLVDKALRNATRSVQARQNGKEQEAMQILLADDSVREINGMLRKIRMSGESLRMIRELHAGDMARATEHWIGWSLALDLVIIAVVITLLLQWKRMRQYVTMCAWSKTFLHDGEWVTPDEFLRRTYDVKVSHGISEKERDKMMATMPQLQNASLLTPQVAQAGAVAA